ncbi:MAG TPA: rhomboid family intramembrane serine protease [Nitrospinota bacterium]|nr:rhomboid family intramembrane serine protease [Nitrospinota bacterium]
METDNAKKALNNQIKTSIGCIFGFALMIWAIELVNMFMGHQLNRFGILPRTFTGLIGIPLSPFLHGGIWHTLMNTVPFVVLGGLIITRGIGEFLEVSLFIILAAGGCLWLFGRASYHVGASGLIFGYFGFIVARGFFDKSISSIIVAFITLFLYGGVILWGLIPISPYISWEGHLFGLIAGVLGSWLAKPE